ncbi:Ribonuclease D related protein [invertebrate metagenome]|uniref:Ribonuclease D related protein n=1 Tax=invertebrate metagenome TaxID=1711999 RepID=A0A484H5Z9_9ZZZZ
MITHYHRRDLPESFSLREVVAVDTETMGLVPRRDRLCVVQLSNGDEHCHVVHLDRSYRCPRLRDVLTDPRTLKIFHFARFDLAVLRHYLDVVCAPVYCTKLASRLARTNIERHSLKDLCRDLLGIELPKQQQSSDWGNENLTPQQIEYAASDVLYLHSLKKRLDDLLKRENRCELAESCFRFLPDRAALDLAGWEDPFAY